MQLDSKKPTDFNGLGSALNCLQLEQSDNVLLCVYLTSPNRSFRGCCYQVWFPCKEALETYSVFVIHALFAITEAKLAAGGQDINAINQSRASVKAKGMPTKRKSSGSNLCIPQVCSHKCTHPVPASSARNLQQSFNAFIFSITHKFPAILNCFFFHSQFVFSSLPSAKNGGASFLPL